MQYKYIEKNKFKVLNSKLITLKITDQLISFLHLLINIIKSVFGKNPEFVGLTRMIYRTCYYQQKGLKAIRIGTLGIMSQGKVVQKLNYSFLKFIPPEGIPISVKAPETMKSLFFEQMLEKNHHLSRDYYRVTGLLLLNLAILPVLNIYFFYKVFMFILDGQFLAVGMQLLVILVTLYFSTNTIVFYFGWRKYFYLQSSFKEASIADEYRLKTSKEQPLVVTMLPSYMEEAPLVKSAIYSACLQNYGHHQVYLLLGNEWDSTNNEVTKNTLEVKKIVEAFKNELKEQYDGIHKDYERFMGLDLLTKDDDEISHQLLTLHKVCLNITTWFEQKIDEFNNAKTQFSTKNFLVENNFRFQLNYYQDKSKQCLQKHKKLTQGYVSDAFKEACVRFLEESFIECNHVFAAKLDVFMRTKYKNLEQEKTKAGNLTAFTSLLGQSFSEVKSLSGALHLEPDPNGKYHYPQPEYLCIFDVDTVAKANYLLRKVVYLENHHEEGAGLIQSPYRITYPEFTNAASASGLSTTWFIPQFMLYQVSNASFWQGFNSVMRYEAFKSVGNFLSETLTEDTEFSLKLRGNGYHIVSSHEYQCQTLSPEDLNSIRGQRVRWCSSGIPIARQLISYMRQGKIRFNNPFEIYCNFSYILGLSKLAVAIMLMWVIYSPSRYDNYSLEIIPFFSYLTAYIFYYPHIAKFKITTLIDGLAMNLFLSINYIQGFFLGLKKLFFKEQNVIFKATARKKSTQGQLNRFEIVALTILTLWNGIQFFRIIETKAFHNFFPIYQLMCIFLILLKFVFKNKRNILDTAEKLDLEDVKYNKSYTHDCKCFFAE